jgi:hypothetical protein
MKGKHHMMPQRETTESMDEQANPTYGRYEENQTSSSHQQYETLYAQGLRGEQDGKMYPLPRDNKNVLRFALAVISLAMLLLFGLLFVVLVGGTAGWVSFAAACLAILTIAAVGIEKIH